MDESVQAKLKRKRKGITARCIEVLSLAFLGKTNGEIAQVLGISPLTVKNHLLHINRHLGAYNRQNAVYKAIQEGLIDVPGYIKIDTICPLPPKVTDILPQEEALDWLRWRDLEICPQTREVRCNGESIKLFQIDFKLLRFFLEHPKSIHDRQHIIDQVWGVGVSIEDRIVDVHVGTLRHKLTKFGHGDLIETVRGVGYRTKLIEVA